MPDPLSQPDTFIALRELSAIVTKLNSENATIMTRFGKQTLTPQFQQECDRRASDAASLSRTITYLSAGCDCGQNKTS